MIKRGSVDLYDGPVNPYPAVCDDCSSPSEEERLLDISSNWMKLFNALPNLTNRDLGKILMLELCGRRRKDLIDRTRAVLDTRFREAMVEELESAYVYIGEKIAEEQEK